MDNKTQLNNEVNATVINSQANNTVINNEISNKTVLNFDNKTLYPYVKELILELEKIIKPLVI